MTMIAALGSIQSNPLQQDRQRTTDNMRLNNQAARDGGDGH